MQISTNSIRESLSYFGLQQFEKNYKKDKENSRTDIMKLEQRTKKAGKKTSAEVLKKVCDFFDLVHANTNIELTANH